MLRTPSSNAERKKSGYFSYTERNSTSHAVLTAGSTVRTIATIQMKDERQEKIKRVSRILFAPHPLGAPRPAMKVGTTARGNTMPCTLSDCTSPKASMRISACATRQSLRKQGSNSWQHNQDNKKNQEDIKTMVQ